MIWLNQYIEGRSRTYTVNFMLTVEVGSSVWLGLHRVALHVRRAFDRHAGFMNLLSHAVHAKFCRLRDGYVYPVLGYCRRKIDIVVPRLRPLHRRLSRKCTRQALLGSLENEVRAK